MQWRTQTEKHPSSENKKGQDTPLGDAPLKYKRNFYY